jgi:predicted HTH domain antitoxin
MISVDFPKPIEDELRRLFGRGLDDAVRQALVVEAFRAARLSIGQAAELLGLTVDAANCLMQNRGVRQEGPSLDDIEREANGLRNRLGPIT